MSIQVKPVPALLDGKRIDTGVRNIIKADAAFGDKLHEVAVQCLLHAHAHNDVSKAGTLCRGLKTANAKGLRHWFMTYGAIWFDGDGTVKTVKKDAKAFHTGEPYDEKGYDLVGAVNTPFWTMAEVQADQAAKVKPFKESDIIRMVFTSQHKMVDAVLGGRFDGRPETSAAMLKAMTEVVFKYAPEQAAAIRAEIEAKLGKSAGPEAAPKATNGHGGEDLRPESLLPPALKAA